MPRRKKWKLRGEEPGAAPAVAPALPPAPPCDYEDSGFDCPQVQGMNLRLVYPSPHGVLRVGLVSRWWFGWLSHWDGSRTLPHPMEPPGSCEQCRLALLPRWCAYALAVAPANKELVMVQVSLQAWKSCPDLAKRHGDLRGQALTLHRRGAGPNQATQATLAPGEWKHGPPPEKDIRPFLSRWWGMRDDWLEWQGGPHHTGIAPPDGWRGKAE